MRALRALPALLLLAGCAKIWGFDELSGPGEAGASGAGGSSSGRAGSGSTASGRSGSGGGACVVDDAVCDGRCGDVVDNCGTLTRCDGCQYPELCGGVEANVCSDVACVPSCADKECGESNGCDGVCSHGACPEGEYCSLLRCVPVDVCGVNAPCPENDCASCDLYCSAEGRCCVESYGCTSNGDCCAGKFCKISSGSSSGYCTAASPAERCSEEIACTFYDGPDSGSCAEGECCMHLGSTCVGTNECCGVLECGVSDKCCVPSQQNCTLPADCCGSAMTCEAGKCCIASGSSGCVSNADCCASSPGCVAGKCQ